MTNDIYREKAIKDQIEDLANAVNSIKDKSESCNISDDSGNIFDAINRYHTASHFLNSDGIRPHLTPMQKYIIGRFRVHYRDATDRFIHCQCRN